VRWRTEAGAGAAHNGAMDAFLWILIGALTGWATYSMLLMNVERGFLQTLLIGALGGLLGGGLVAPHFVTAAPAGSGTGGGDALLFALMAALVLLAAGNHLAKRWGI